jgi:hypothetical protein
MCHILLFMWGFCQATKSEEGKAKYGAFRFTMASE